MFTSQVPVRARVRGPQLCYWLLPEGEEGRRPRDAAPQSTHWSPVVDTPTGDASGLDHLLGGAYQSDPVSFFQCFPEGTDMTSILDFYFQVSDEQILFRVTGETDDVDCSVVEAPTALARQVVQVGISPALYSKGLSVSSLFS